jgi:2-oxoglutarate ferredoxin oxidoreductase subunit beta
MAFIEVVSACPTYFGKYNKLGDSVDMLKILESIEDVVEPFTVSPYEATSDMNRIVCGEFVNAVRPEYTHEYKKIREIAERNK